MKNHFLLTNELAAKLYDAAGFLPVIDWHNHLSIADLVSDQHFTDLTELWIANDPYKHRAMRICGVPEGRITGNATSYDKFLAWSETVPKLIGNPLYHWTMLELKRVFDLDCELNAGTAEKVWQHANKLLRQDEFSARSFLRKFKVEYAAPCMELTANPDILRDLDDIVPSLRGDNLMAPSRSMITELEKATGTNIDSFADFARAVAMRLDKFHEAGCRFADHALDGGFRWIDTAKKEEIIFSSFLKDGTTNIALQSAILILLAGEYAKRGWTLQLHIGAERQTSSRLRQIAGPTGGYAGIGHPCDIKSLTHMLDMMESSRYGLPRVILYTLNPADNAALAVLSGSYTEAGLPGKVQLGPAWWFCDHLFGMRECFETIASFGVLSVFGGMTTDSRSLLSFVRHEYFRRVFCNWVAEKALADEMPEKFDTLLELTENVFYHNSKKWIKKD